MWKFPCELPNSSTPGSGVTYWSAAGFPQSNSPHVWVTAAEFVLLGSKMIIVINVTKTKKFQLSPDHQSELEKRFICSRLVLQLCSGSTVPFRVPTWKGQESNVKHLHKRAEMAPPVWDYPVGSIREKLRSAALAETDVCSLPEIRQFWYSLFHLVHSLKQKMFVCFMRDSLSAAEWAWLVVFPRSRCFPFTTVVISGRRHGRLGWV